MQLVEVEGVNTFLSPNKDMLIVGVRMNPTSSAVDFKWAPIEHFRKTSTHVNFRGWGQSI